MTYLLAKPTNSDPRSLTTSIVGIADRTMPVMGKVAPDIQGAVTTLDVSRNDVLLESGYSARRIDSAHTESAFPSSALAWNCDVSRSHTSAPAAVSSAISSSSSNPASKLSENCAGARSLSEPPLNSSKISIETQRPVQATDSTRILRHLLAESAHEVRAPLAVASQLIRASLSQLPSTANELSDVRRCLTVADGRLQQASQWAENILAWRRLAGGMPLSIRKRFYADQWKSIVEPILRGLAEAKKVNLNWIGWDRSLPRVYLDPNHLARVVVNLVSNAIDASHAGQTVSIRVSWQTNVVHRLIMTIEDSGKGLRQDLLEFLNGPRLVLPSLTTKVSNGLGLQNAKQLCVSLGGSVIAQLTSTGGTAIRLSLPIDERTSLLRSWLGQQLRVDRPAIKRDVQFVNHGEPSVLVFAIKYAGDASSLGSFLNDSIQKQATSSDLVYCIGAGRWIWIAIDDHESQARIRAALKRSTDLLVTEHKRSQDAWLVQLCQTSNWIGSSSGKSAAMPSPASIMSLVNRIAGVMDELIGEHVPPVDSLVTEQVPAATKSIEKPSQRSHFRVDQSAVAVQPPKGQSPRIKPRRIGTIEDVDSNTVTGQHIRTDQAADPNARHALAQVATTWRDQHDLLMRTAIKAPTV